MNIKDLVIMLIGDSITEGFDVNKLLPELSIINKGVSGDSTVETYNRIEKEWFILKPHKIFICIGTNDIARGRDDEFIILNIKKIVEKLRINSPKSDIIITSLFPTRNNPERSNERINNLNLKLRSFSDSESMKYLDMNQHFKDDQGKLKKEYSLDGLHLNEAAYKQWAIKLLEFCSLTNINKF